KSDAGLELLHFHTLQLLKSKSPTKLEVDNLVMEIIRKSLEAVTDYEPDPRIHARLKKNHLTTIERAKEYITSAFHEDISLMEIANYCHVSPFHFSRIFKTFTGSPPHQFLLLVRLQHAAMLLQNTRLPVADIAFTSGFNSIENFTTAFRQKYQVTPTVFRLSPVEKLTEKSKIS
ncbi:MAG TPA: AraC family transcriptional regulator, partial [Chitinophagaceae bacterium]|nr:AraC family transcriptional regulator [Chitinophagaceae bacterium]